MERLSNKLFVGMAIFSLTAVNPSWGLAQETTDQEPFKLNEVVVTATRDMTVMDTPASISVITSRDLENMGVKTRGIRSTSASNWR